ncbi:hypothetical protein ILUMI_09466 [Ignelater luminosus]|uniref:Olfactomedin-like domain-containing protein n=1 Tax=Ignelater luminosus TaxID=2038154 RepID=A0A8K0D3T6_IGNLU|nr:hypothetical protein ILUMI_09466 [Ignelater luminosus]
MPHLTKDNLQPLYKARLNYFDFSVDDIGLWVFFAVPDTNNIGVAKASVHVNADTLSTQCIWNITLDHRKFTEMFVAHGVLYAIDDFTENKHKISIAVDLYTDSLLPINMNEFGQFNYVSMATFDFANKQLLVLDKGNRLGFPVSC